MMIRILVLLLLPLQMMAHPGVGIVEDSRGNVYYTDLKQVWQITPGGKKSVVVKNVHTHELYIDENDNLYGEHLWYEGEATNTWGHFVWKRSPDGTYVKVIPDQKGFLENYSFVRDHFGRMYWAYRTKECQHVMRLNPNQTTTELGDECLENIHSMTASKSGNVYVLDNHEVKKVNTQGHTSTIADLRRTTKKNSAKGEDLLSGIALDEAQNLYVADYSERCVKKITPDGRVSVLTTTAAPWSPSGMLAAKDGSLYVLENSENNEVRVEKITPHGERTVL